MSAPSGYTLEAFQTRVIDQGIAAARDDYAGQSDHALHMRAGAIAGFEACRLKPPAELALLLREAGERRERAFRDRAPDYWFWSCRAAEVEWVCNCVSAILHNQGLPVIIPPTARGYLCAAEIVGVGPPE